jgi:hypothetical protein
MKSVKLDGIRLTCAQIGWNPSKFRPSFFSFLNLYYILAEAKAKRQRVDEAQIVSLGVWVRLKSVKLLQVWAHVGRIPSNLTDSIHLGLTLQIFETSEGWIANF